MTKRKIGNVAVLIPKFEYLNNAKAFLVEILNFMESMCNSKEWIYYVKPLKVIWSFCLSGSEKVPNEPIIVFEKDLSFTFEDFICNLKNIIDFNKEFIDLQIKSKEAYLDYYKTAVKDTEKFLICYYNDQENLNNFLKGL